MRYDLPERRTPSKLRLIFPTLVLVAVLAGIFFGMTYALTFLINAACALIEGLL